jgi:RNA polymerase sigma-70 factor (ECF subfamily)
MDSVLSAKTSPTLLVQLGRDPIDQAAWVRFVHLYGPRIISWCRRWGLQEADAQDVTQDVLVKLADKMRTFRYDPARSFRGWLKTLTKHALSDFTAARQRRAAAGGDSGVLDHLRNVEARDDLIQRLQETFDHELLEAAMARVRLRVTPHIWEAFRLTALEGLSGAEAAARLGMKVANVFVAKSDVRQMLTGEVRKLQGPATK